MSDTITQHKNESTQLDTTKTKISNNAGSQVGLPTKTISFTAFAGLITAYTHFFGLSYRKSFLEGAGFESLNVSLTPPESIYYATQGYSSALLRAISGEDFSLLSTDFISTGLAFVIVILFYKFFDKKIGTGANTKTLKSKIRNMLDKATKNTTKTVITSLIGFVLGYIAQIIFMIVLLAILTVLWAIMSLGIGAGLVDGQNLIRQPICSNINWQKQNKERVLGCRTLPLKDGNSLSGIRIHSEKDTTFFLTNDGAYELKDGLILSYRAIHKKPMATNK